MHAEGGRESLGAGPGWPDRSGDDARVDGRRAYRSMEVAGVVEPLALGLKEPTRFFWPFIEGFELDLDGWRVGEGADVRTDSSAKNGRAALIARVPADRHATTVTTTPVR